MGVAAGDLWAGCCAACYSLDFLGTKSGTPVSTSLEVISEENGELRVPFERQLAIESVEDDRELFSSRATQAPSKGKGPMVLLWSSLNAEPRCQARIADYSANTLPGHPLRL